MSSPQITQNTSKLVPLTMKNVLANFVIRV
jgi:hypothetical protein